MGPSLPPGAPPPVFAELISAIGAAGHDTKEAEAIGRASPLGVTMELPGPVGELNVYRLAARGAVLCVAATAEAALRQIAAVIATGNRAIVACEEALDLLDRLPKALAPLITRGAVDTKEPIFAALFEGSSEALLALNAGLAEREGMLVPVYPEIETDDGARTYPLEYLLAEQSVSTNTAAAGGNASLMSIG